MLKHERSSIARRFVPLAMLLALATYLALAASVSAEPVTNRAPGQFKLLTWNIQMLPTFPSVPPLQKKQALRAPWIVEFLNEQDYDIVVLQEVIDRKMTEILKEGLKGKYPHVLAADAKRGISGCSGGILIVSKIPLKYVTHTVYKHVSGVDGLAEKGCLLVEGELDGVKFQLAGTHLQAGDEAMKVKELTEIREGIILPYKLDGVPQILVGDMNIAADSEHYQRLLDTTEMTDYPLNDDHPYTVDGKNSWNPPRKQPKRIDYVLLNPRGTQSTIVRQTIQRAKHPHEGGVMDLADHYGVAAEIVLKK